MKRYIKEIIKQNIPNVSSSNEHNLTLTHKGQIGDSDRAIVWKGYFDKIPVAIKITWDKQAVDREMRIYNALYAIENPMIETFGIPNVYFYGPIFMGRYHAIAMTFCDETIEDRYVEQDEQFSDLSILLILKRAVTCSLRVELNKLMSIIQYSLISVRDIAIFQH